MGFWLFGLAGVILGFLICLPAGITPTASIGCSYGDPKAVTLL